VQYGVASVSIMGQVGNVYLNFGLWAVALWPAWIVIREFGTREDVKMLREEKPLDKATDMP
jgi:hypothetical protein